MSHLVANYHFEGSPPYDQRYRVSKYGPRDFIIAGVDVRAISFQGCVLMGSAWFGFVKQTVSLRAR